MDDGDKSAQRCLTAAEAVLPVAASGVIAGGTTDEFNVDAFFRREDQKVGSWICLSHITVDIKQAFGLRNHRVFPYDWLR